MKNKLHIKHSLALAALAVFMLLPGKGWGQLLVEDFNYSLGTVLTTTATPDPITGWLAHSGNGTQNIDVTSGLSFLGYAGSGIGGAANVDNNGQDINKTFTSQTSGTVYVAFMLQTSSTNSAGYFFMLSSTPVNSTFNSRIFVNATGDGIGLSATSTAPATYVTITPGTPVLVVIKHDFTSNTTDLFVLNTFSATEPGSASQSISETYTTTGAVAIRQYNAAQKIIVDGIRVGNTWTDIFGAPSTPSISITGSFTPFATSVGTPSASQYVDVSGTNLTGNIEVSAVTGYEYSTTDAAPWTSTLSLPSSFNAKVYVRLTGASVGSPAGTISFTSTGATQVDKAVSGVVNPLTPVINVIGTFSAFSTTVGTPSASQSVTVSGSNLTANIEMSAVTGYEYSTTDAAPWTTTLSLASSFSGNVYVRLTGASQGSPAGTISFTSTGATQVDRTVTGNVTVPTPVIAVTVTFTAFATTVGTPSASQSVAVSGSDLTANIDVSAVAGYEYSTTDAAPWTSTLSLASSFSGNVYVRLTGVSLGSYSGTISFTSAGATQVDKTISGSVYGLLADNLFFSEYIEGSSNNKALEIYNASGVSVDLSRYQVLNYANGSVTPTNTLNLTGTLAAGDVYVIANASANSAILAQSDITSTVTFFNGDDAVALRCTMPASDLDIIGVIGNDPGVGWAVAGIADATLNHTLIRKPTIADGNTDWTSSAGTNTTDSEWNVLAQDYTADLGTHTYNPGGSYVETPTFNPVGGTYYSTQNVTISCATSDATIFYSTTSNTGPWIAYSLPISVPSTITIWSYAEKAGMTNSLVAQAAYTISIPIDVADIATLRAGTTGTAAYRLTGEAVLTYKTTSNNVKYIQDASGAILIFDPTAKITTNYNLYDGISGIIGTLELYNNMLEFKPVADPGAATSVNNIIVPEEVTLLNLTTDYQAKLVKVVNATISDIPAGTGLFVASTNYTLTDATGTDFLRTAYADLNYIGQSIPTVAKNITGVVLQFAADMQLVPRSLADFETSEPTNHATAFSAGTTTTTTIPLTWTDATTGAVLPAAYLIKGSSVSYAAIAAPVDGIPETDGGLVKNITQGTGLYTFTDLTPGTPYFFKIYPYSGDGTARNYKTGSGVPETTGTTLADSKTLNVKVFLEGPYAGAGVMNTTLNPGLIPLSQPYNVAPWNYAGIESVTAVPTGVVDWVLVDLRDATTPATALPSTSLSGWPKALFLKSDGTIVDLNGTSLPNIIPTVVNNLYVVVRHRNHIAIMSNTGMISSPTAYSYDFTTAITQAYNGGAGYKEIAIGVFGLVAGDADADGSIYPSDYNEWASKYNSTGYKNSDFDMDSNVYPSDYNKWASNYNKGNPISKGMRHVKYSSQVPVSNSK